MFPFFWVGEIHSIALMLCRQLCPLNHLHRRMPRDSRRARICRGGERRRRTPGGGTALLLLAARLSSGANLPLHKAYELLICGRVWVVCAY